MANPLICSDTPMSADVARSKGFHLIGEVAKFEEACVKARALAKALGDGWAARVWENLGWHYEAISPCRRMNVYPSSLDNHYTAMLHEPDDYSHPAYLGEPGKGKTPQKAVANLLRNAKARVAHIQSLIEGL